MSKKEGKGLKKIFCAVGFGLIAVRAGGRYESP